MRRFPFTAGSGFFGLCWLFFRTFFCSVFVLICWSFFDRFGVPKWGVFGAKNRSTCDLWVFVFYWFYIGFSTTFASWGVLCWFYIGSFCASFFASIFGRFGGRFWSPFGSLWGVQIDHFWHQFLDDFCMSFQERPKSAQERPKSGPRAPKSAPRAPKRGPKGAKSGPRGAQERPRGAQERPQSTQWAAKRAKYVLFLALESRLAALYIYI